MFAFDQFNRVYFTGMVDLRRKVVSLLTPSKSLEFTNGTIYLPNYLGGLFFAVSLDNVAEISGEDS